MRQRLCFLATLNHQRAPILSNFTSLLRLTSLLPLLIPGARRSISSSPFELIHSCPSTLQPPNASPDSQTPFAITD